MDNKDPFEWPKTLRVGGREYELHPEMTMSEMMEAQSSLQNETEKIALLHYAMRGDDLDDEVKEMLPFDPDEENMEEYR